MLIRRPPDIATSEITDESLYLNRRSWLAAAGLTVAAMLPERLHAAARNRSTSCSQTSSCRT